MRLTPKLLRALNRVFDKDPGRFVGLRVRYAGDLAWSIAEGVLTLTVAGGVGASVTYNLEGFTLRTLVANIAGRAGFEVTHLDPERADLSALVLLDGAGDQAESNGDALYGYTSLLWAIFESWGRQLQIVHDQIDQALRQMTTRTAEGVWLDELGSFYGVTRQVGEVDALYGPRIIAESLRPVSNNIALERAIADYTGTSCTVIDVAVYAGLFPIYDGAITHNGAYDYDTVGFPHYGLFDVVVAYDLIGGGDITTFSDSVQGIVNRLRAAGTHMRSLALSSGGAPLVDAFPFAPTDTSSSYSVTLTGIAEALTAPSEATSSLAGVIPAIVEACPAPTENCIGAILQGMTTSAGAPITDSLGNQLQAQVESLFP